MGKGILGVLKTMLNFLTTLTQSLERQRCLKVCKVEGEKRLKVYKVNLMKQMRLCAYKIVSCIPEGTYQTGWRKSPKFGETWQIEDVPNRTYILIHAANYPKDVHGCIGLGTSLMGDKLAVSQSRIAVGLFEGLTKESEWQLEITHAPLAGLQSQ